MKSLDDTAAIGRTVDTAFHYTGLAVRAVGYLAVYALADRYDCGPAILTGVLLGDFLGQAIKVFVNWHNGLLAQIADLFLIGVVFLFVRSSMTWPDEPAMRAILGLSAFGLIVGHTGNLMMSRVDARHG